MDCFLQVQTKIFDLEVVFRIGLGKRKDLFLIGQLRLLERVLGILHLLALHVAHDEQQRPLLHRVPGLHAHGADLPGLLHDDLVALVGGNGTAAPNLRVDRAGLHHLGRHFRQGVVHDSLGEKGQQQHNHQENDGYGFN